MFHAKIIGVMGSKSFDHEAYSVPLGQLIAQKECHLLTGGGKGTMTKVSEAFCDARAMTSRALCLGVIPSEQGPDGQFHKKEGYPNPFVEISIQSPLGVFTGLNVGDFTRNHINIMTSDMIIALPGEKGTVNEVELALQAGKPLILFGPQEAFAQFPQDPERTTDIARVAAFIESNLG